MSRRLVVPLRSSTGLRDDSRSVPPFNANAGLTGSLGGWEGAWVSGAYVGHVTIIYLHLKGSRRSF